MTEPATKEPTAEEVAAAEEARANNLAVGRLKGHASSDEPLRMVEDAYVGIVGTARRVNAGDTGASVADVQRECDLVFGPGKVDANDIVTPPEPEAKDDSKATAKK